MKLFYFSGSTIPSSFANSVHVMKMCAAFAEAGHDVTLFGKGQGGADVFSRYDVPQSFKLALAPLVTIPKIGGFVRLLYTMMKAKCLGRADIIYGRDFWTLSAMADKKMPIMLELHEIPKTGSKSENLLRKILNAQNLLGIVVISGGLKQDLLQFHAYPDDKILVAHDGADIPKGEIEPTKLKIPDNSSFQIGYGGSLYPGKGVEIIIEIAKAVPNIGFHICGGPNQELEKWRAHDLPSNMIFYGHLDQIPLQAHLSACDALIAPYLPKIQIDTGADISRWISPLKLFEYMALKKPILCSDLPVLRETMRDGHNALLAAPDNIEDWIGNIHRLRDDNELANYLSINAYQDLKSTYSWSIRAKNILQFLQKLS